VSKIPKALSPGEEALQLHLRAEKVLFICEYEFCPGRKWRFDFVLTGEEHRKIGIEIEGGVWSGGRHTRGKPFERDCEKHNMAVKLGWSVLRYSTDMVLAGDAINDILELVRPERANALREEILA
jgi:very-short-patch-repair endonuclease